jgi:hypothetical protein
MKFYQLGIRQIQGEFRVNQRLTFYDQIKSKEF